MRAGAVLLWLCWTVPGLAQVTLSADEARLTAAQLLSAGQFDAAADVTAVLTQRDPGDAAGLILRAHALRNLGQLDAAQEVARAGWKSASRDVERYGAALAMAQALSSDGHKMRA